MIHRVVKKAQNLQYGDASDCMLKLVELCNYHKSKGDVFELASGRGGRSEILNWSGSFSSLFIERYGDFLLNDRTDKTNISNLSLVVATVVDSLGVSVLTNFLVTSFENSSSIERYIDLLKIYSNSLSGLSMNTTMTDERSALVKVASFMSGFNHCLCAFHVNQLAVRVS